jgi:hypothetical protein
MTGALERVAARPEALLLEWSDGARGEFPSIAPLRLAAAETSAFYAAYRRFAALLREPSGARAAPTRPTSGERS